MNRLKQIINNFIADFTDKSAEKKYSSSWVREVWTTSGVAFTAAASYISVVSDLSTKIIGEAKGFIEMIILLFGILWSFVLVCSKGKENDYLKYSYVQPVRIFGKVSLMVLSIFLLPMKVYTAYVESIPLPTTIYGVITEVNTGLPIEGARILITTADGVDVTKGIWLTDSRGFFIVETRTQIHYSSFIQFFSTSCSDSSKYPLSKAFQVSPEDLLMDLSEDIKPLFHYSLKCHAQ